ncbi:MBL fold metallo-hydrolase [Peribacillus cavernae]|uniref:MBL fold metallo-hydrolase n=1 Tax=Peribacillus cavernae TaxID=1674310 RepID=A0A3S0U1G3_9BACI|nr:MBL fold metallo-hydrolase [Peribacillus cavernae]MDQ0217803.1 glyoxylase-like metal-dependent hydrolase (beta-lactamase superfamily II) [Peribacillus cavernae]RUQ28255.1 MBL fold metallo-hydrolase [Peribacillus cavernae]
MDDHNLSQKFIPVTSVTSGDVQSVTSDIYCLPIQIVNICYIGDPAKSSDWVLVDAGMPRSADEIIGTARKLYGESVPPKAIILTHGHFDHVGALVELVEHWNVPVYAHELEMPYLTGKKNYPQPDSTVEGGMVAKMSGLFPNEGIDLGTHVRTLPADGSVPELPDWKWIHTPGHSEGQVSLFRESDRALIAGDAFVTVKQESLYKVITQEKEISGPPRYLTTDWKAAKTSVEKLADLKPSVAVTGHGLPMSGRELADNLTMLAREFDTIAKPDYGKYVQQG